MEKKKGRRPSGRKSRTEKLKAKVTNAFLVPPGEKKLFVIEAAIEVQSKDELEQIVDGIGRILCPVPPETDHRCARRWMVMTHPADKAEIASWDPILNET